MSGRQSQPVRLRLFVTEDYWVETGAFDHAPYYLSYTFLPFLPKHTDPVTINDVVALMIKGVTDQAMKVYVAPYQPQTPTVSELEQNGKEALVEFASGYTDYYFTNICYDVVRGLSNCLSNPDGNFEVPEDARISVYVVADGQVRLARHYMLLDGDTITVADVLRYGEQPLYPEYDGFHTHLLLNSITPISTW